MWLRLSIFFAALFVAAPAFALGTVTVMADPSLSVAIAQIARNYSAKSGVVVNTSFLPQKAQSTQISDGASADILITPNLAWVADLKTQGLVDFKSQYLIARNQLALAGPADSTMAMNGQFPTLEIIQASAEQPSFLIPSPETLAEGAYSKEALHSVGASSDLEPYTLYVKQLDQMFDMVAHQGAYGLFFYSNVIGRSDMKVIGVLPETTHKAIEYSAAVIAGDNMDEARKFLDYLKTPQARKILERNGFLPN